MNAPARTLFIINPASARARRAWPKIKSALVAADVCFDAHETTHAGDATVRTRAALRDGYNLIAVVGGDGSLSEAASGFFEFQDSDSNDSNESRAVSTVPSPINSAAALAILPAGTGDDFARGLKGRREPLKNWLARFIAYYRSHDSAAAHTVDVIHGRVEKPASDFLCLNVVTLGLGAEVAARVAAQGSVMRRLPGEARFVSAACGALAAWRERPVRVIVDESEVIESRTNLIALANGIYAGGGMMFAPEARNDDGLIDLLLTQGLTRASILRELPRIRRGAHLANERVRLIRARHVYVETDKPEDSLLIEADGNVRGHTPAEFRLIPSAIRVIKN